MQGDRIHWIEPSFGLGYIPISAPIIPHIFIYSKVMNIRNKYAIYDMKKIFLLLMISLLFSSKVLSGRDDLTEYVNPFIGTGGHGHTFPGPTLPFGMMQLSPDTRLEGWDGCSGYHYSDSVVYGFTHTHLSGTGCSDYGDILLMPTNKVVFNNGADGNIGYCSKFSHKNETASPGYYSVMLEDSKIKVELTTTPRCGIHRYTYPENAGQVVILDLEHRDRLLDCEINKISDTEITGLRRSRAWANDQRLFFYIKFSKPIINTEYYKPEGAEKNTKAAFTFDKESAELNVYIAISPVSAAGAKANYQAEIHGKTFADVRENARKIWNSQLRKIEIETKIREEKEVFYTALYHSVLAPNLYQDVDGSYRGIDLKIYKNSDFNYYTVFSLWDTYRASHPLFTIIEQERTNDFIKTLIAKYNEGGIMPIWDLSACYTGCMIGYHGVSVISDAYIKGIRDYDANEAFKAMKHSAMQDHLGLKGYKEFGYIPMEEESESVSKTLEYAYDDWTIAQIAKELNNKTDYQRFVKRAQNYKNILDPDTKFMRARYRNTWFSPFDPYEVNFNYTEANSWQYSFYVPQDISGFIGLIGGKDVMEKQLDALFSANEETSGRHQSDISGLIGQYAHGNEPSHHIAYLYNFINKPHKTQKLVRQICTELYNNSPDGISGNEDCGQMSAWYIFSAIGFYPVTPGSDEYVIGAPQVSSAVINLESGKTFRINAKNLSENNLYIESVKLNGKDYPYSFIKHGDIMKGGKLEFSMTNKPTYWGSHDDNIPSTSIDDYQIVPPSFVKTGELSFRDSTLVSLGNIDDNVKTYYSLNNSEYKDYSVPFYISDDADLKVYSQKGNEKSPVLETTFRKIDPNLSIKLETQYANQYNAGGDNALIDGIKGSNDFKTNVWQGYENKDLDATVDLGSVREITTISTGFLSDQRSWIMYPTEVEYFISADGKEFKKLASEKIELIERNSAETKEITKNFSPRNARYVKVIAKCRGALPEWHIGHGPDGFAWIFADEITIK